MIMKFKDHPNAQAKMIINEDGSMELQSYETIVVKVDREGWLRIVTMRNPKTGELSMTTGHHISWFLRELGIKYQPYQLAKQLYFDNAEMNVGTGEIRVHMTL